ncbi:cell division protein ZapE [Pararhizobium haloflavum]|uniref:cell division protein ZapE n=1 Tax=Pararhizobium haloflavum TaxID=2037914 RepID=UPI000C17CEEB|nr:cell division protein ZapE [Pararhizobium haloflavum]
MDTKEFASVAQRYEAMVRSERIERDPAQEALASELDRVIHDIRDRRMASKSSALGWLFAKKRRGDGKSRVKGLYVHGAVGRGKTMLMDLFFHAVPAKRKRRVHFHDFMADVHERIHAHRAALKRGETKQDDPIPPVAAALYDEAWVLCFDEFSVTDITDAMILSRLFTQLFERGAVLIATSNVAPDDLYKDGLNRQLFTPFIDLLKTYTKIVSLDARTDYRLEKLERQPVYLHPVDAKARATFEKAWREEIAGETVARRTIAHRGREIVVPKAANGSARFTFDDLCAQPLGASDYGRIAAQFDTVFIEDIPVLSRSRRNEAKRFIMLVDTLYDARRRAFMLAAAAPEALYAEKSGTEGFEFERTASRLMEMQSADYIKESEKKSTEASSNSV